MTLREKICAVAKMLNLNWLSTYQFHDMPLRVGYDGSLPPGAGVQSANDRATIGDGGLEVLCGLINTKANPCSSRVVLLDTRIDLESHLSGPRSQMLLAIPMLFSNERQAKSCIETSQTFHVTGSQHY